MARDVLPILAMAANVERLFSAAKLSPINVVAGRQRLSNF
jgi:hypothetical protein